MPLSSPRGEPCGWRIKPARSGWRPGNLSLDRAERVWPSRGRIPGIGIPAENIAPFRGLPAGRRQPPAGANGGTGLGCDQAGRSRNCWAATSHSRARLAWEAHSSSFLPAIYREERQASRPAAGVEAIPRGAARPRPPDEATACDGVRFSARPRLTVAQNGGRRPPHTAAERPHGADCGE